ncbi:MAG: hypothetical protein M0Z75_10030 [Nitrospiraceae bacterium]|nr:hypothetical protein [Nitrospiraceae bacterium]
MKLGEAMVKEGLITNDALARALERQIIFGGRLGTNLVEMGAISEENLAKFLGRVLNVPYAGPAQFENVSQDAIDSVTAEQAQKYTIFPLRKERSKLHLAMKDPNDFAVVDELRFVFGTEIREYIASEIRIFYALEKYYGIKRDLRYVSVLNEEDAWSAKSRAQDMTFVPKPVKEQEPVSAREAPEAQEEPEPEEAPVYNIPEPALEPAQPDVSRHGPVPGHPSPYELLAMPVDRESVASAIVAAAREKLSRAALFKVKDGILTGWQCALPGGAADISKLGMAVALPGIFKDVVEKKLFYKGPVAPLPQNEILLNALGAGRSAGPLEAIACPLVIRGKVVAVLYADNGPGSSAGVDIDFFASLMAKASMSLEILILKNKILS